MLTAATPSARLARSVEAFWLSEDYVPPHSRERILPSGTLSLIVDLRDDKAIVCGAQTKSFILDTAQQESVIGVRLRQGGASSFLGGPAFELREKQMNLEDLRGIDAKFVRE